jgi:hypothetical protein
VIRTDGFLPVPIAQAGYKTQIGISMKKLSAAPPSAILVLTGLLLLAGANPPGVAFSKTPSQSQNLTSEQPELLDRLVAVADARVVMDEFMTTFNARDPEAWAATFNYPHVRIASNSVRISQTADEVAANMDFTKFAENTGWHHSDWDSIEMIQAGSNKVHFAVTFSRFTADGTRLQSYESLYVVTLKEGHWGIQSRSSFAP